MKTLVLATIATLTLASSASAFGEAVYLPNLTFPTTETVVVTKDCLATTAATELCDTKN